MGERIEVDAVKFDKAIHILKRLAYDEVKRKRGLLLLGVNHIEGHLKETINILYDAVK